MPPVVAVLVNRPDASSGLAAEIGLPHAMRLQRLLLQRALGAAESAGIAPTLWFRPPDARATIQQWLGDTVDLRPQASGGLGARIAAAAAGAALPAGWLVITRAAPGLETALPQAIGLLQEAPYVIGPSADGGCYLVGGRSPVFAALRELESAGPGALDALRSGLRAAHHSWRECAVLPPLECASDARAARLLS